PIQQNMNQHTAARFNHNDSAPGNSLIPSPTPASSLLRPGVPDAIHDQGHYQHDDRRHQPAQPLGGKGQGAQPGNIAFDETGSLQSVDDTEDQCNQHDRTHDVLWPLPARQEQAEQNQHDRQRIEPYQHRYGDPDQAIQPLVGYGHAEDGEDPDHLRITEWELPTEESATGRYQAHRGGQARQGDDYCQQQAASSAEAVLDKGCEDLAAVGTGLDQRAAGGAQLE